MALYRHNMKSFTLRTPRKLSLWGSAILSLLLYRAFICFFKILITLRSWLQAWCPWGLVLHGTQRRFSANAFWKRFVLRLKRSRKQGKACRRQIWWSRTARHSFWPWSPHLFFHRSSTRLWSWVSGAWLFLRSLCGLRSRFRPELLWYCMVNVTHGHCLPSILATIWWRSLFRHWS